MNATTKRLIIGGMTCPHCQARVQQALLGVPGAVIIGHGSSSHRAIYNAVKAGVAAATNDVSGMIAKSIAEHAEDAK